MKVRHFRNADVELYTFQLPTGEDLTLDPAIGADQASFLAENGWAYAYGVTVLLDGVMTITSDLFPDSTIIYPDHDHWINGVDKMSGTPHTFTALEDAKFACLSYRDHHLPSTSDKVMLVDAESYSFDIKGWVYVCSGALSVGGTEYSTESLLEVSTVGKIATAVGDTVLSVIGE